MVSFRHNGQLYEADDQELVSVLRDNGVRPGRIEIKEGWGYVTPDHISILINAATWRINGELFKYIMRTAPGLIKKK